MWYVCYVCGGTCVTSGMCVVVCACLCVSVFVQQRERERENESGKLICFGFVVVVVFIIFSAYTVFIFYDVTAALMFNQGH